MDSLVEIRGQVPVTTSRKLAEGVGLEHRAIMQLVRKYERDIHDVGTSAFRKQKFSTGGRTGEEAVLDEIQACFLITLMQNKPNVLKFKKALTKEFYRMRQIISALKDQRNDAEWQQQRIEGKQRYMVKIDVVKQFVDYATAQGSQNANKYYANLAQMENRALFFIEQKYPNLRDVLDLRQLMLVAVADDVIEKALKEGMVNSLHYKECYQLAKDRVSALASVVGKSPVQNLIGAIQ
jgi:phage regulator Rha-like protein